MSESQSMIVDTAERLFGELTADADVAFGALWPRIEEIGFADLLMSQDEGGFGGTMGDAFAVLKVAGGNALPLPLAEAIIGRVAAARAGIGEDAPQLVTIATRWTGEAMDGRFTGTAMAVPWGRDAQAVVLTGNGQDLLIMSRGARVERCDSNLAGEPRDTLSFSGAEARVIVGFSAFHLGALLRAAQIAGAMDAALGMSIGYANDRVQFGRSIGKFQAIQHNLAVFAEEAAASLSAGESAARAVEAGDGHFEIACAKFRASKAAATGHATAHAVHGAIGFTKEHSLHHLTRRLLAWRSEFGGQAYWSDWIGKSVVAKGEERFWPDLTARSDAVSWALSR